MTGAVLIDLRKAFDTLDHAGFCQSYQSTASKMEKCLGLVVICLTESNLLYIMERVLKSNL